MVRLQMWKLVYLYDRLSLGVSCFIRKVIKGFVNYVQEVPKMSRFM